MTIMVKGLYPASGVPSTFAMKLREFGSKIIAKQAINGYFEDMEKLDPAFIERGVMKSVQPFRWLPLFCVLSLMLVPRLLLASTNAQPWDEQEAERNAQEEITSEEKSAQEEMGSSIYGRITSIDPNAKVLSLLPTDEVENKEEEDDDDDTSQDFHFNSDTTLTGIDEIGDLAPGDYVTLEYYTFRDKNKVTEISLDRDDTSKNDGSSPKEYSPGVLVG
jgi:hypothetical protein